MKLSFLTKYLIIILIAGFLTSCYEDFLVINSDFESGVISSDSTKIFFFHTLKVGQPPKGISKFSDGGAQKILYKNVSLYCYSVGNQKLSKIFDFGNLPYESWNYNLSVQNETLIFGIYPSLGWEWRIDHSNDSSFNDLKNRFLGFHKYDTKDGKLKRFVYDGYNQKLSPDENQIVYLKKDSSSVEIWHFLLNENKNQLIKTIESNSTYFPIYWISNDKIAYKKNEIYNAIDLGTSKTNEINKDFIPIKKSISIKEIKEFTKHFSFQDWGFSLTDYWKKNKNEYINDIILINGNLNYRKAILQILSKNLNKEDIENIINQMRKYGKSLEGLEKTEYEIYSQETIELLNLYLNSF